MAHKARFGLLLARTDPEAPKHKGLTAFIIDMHQPGVEVRRIRSMAGASGFNEVFFTDATVPDSMRVGDVGDGWRIGNATLMNERVSIGSEVAPQGSGPIASAVAAWRACTNPTPVRPRPAHEALGRRRGAAARQPARAGEAREGRARARRARSLKLLSGRVQTGVSELVVDLMGPAGTLLRRAVHASSSSTSARSGAATRCCRSCGAPGGTIAGGTTQIQMNILGERVLGLPREPGLDPDTPWSQIPRN